MHRNVEAADAMLSKLSDLLRITLTRASQQVTLKAELDFLEKYLDIERTRFGDRLAVRFDVDPDTLDAAIPNMLLQPLVENALRHGIGPKVSGGHIDVTATRAGDRLQLSVRDDGYGMPPEKLDAITSGVGLRNTRSRLEHTYGDRHTFELRQVPGGGLEVAIEIPFVADAEALGSNPMESVA
jgi:sensor histidine kinase YesM